MECPQNLRNDIIDEARKGLRIHCYGIEMDIPFFACTVPEEDIYDYCIDSTNGWIYVKCISTDIADLVDIEEIIRQIEVEEILESELIPVTQVAAGTATGFDQYIRISRSVLKYKH